KFKTNAIRLPTNFESLGSYLQSVARKMNIRITKRSPILATAGGHYKFHDLGPDVPRSKAGAKVSPERQKQIDALESGEYTGKSNKGTGKEPDVSYGKVYPTRQIDLEAEGHIIDRVRDLRGRLSNRLKEDGNFAYSEVDIPGIDKKEFYAHSGLNGDNKAKDYADFSIKPTKKPKYEATKAPDKSGRIYKRDMDTEYKILNDRRYRTTIIGRRENRLNFTH
ncbi:deaminase domain-containing protein, partial [Paenibacillus terrae]|uniref:deaminase domain-containing protein n=1 Tax=Paenibacillus terrae TaxID=159743 RepID=UPI0025A2EA06